MREQEILAIGLAPLAWVAWADGTVDEAERQAVLAGAESCGLQPQDESFSRLAGWLEDRPPDAVRRGWEHLVGELRQVLPTGSWDRFRMTLLLMAFDVADASGDARGEAPGISDEEARTIAAIRDACDGFA